jgi:hypothetical protein
MSERITNNLRAKNTNFKDSLIKHQKKDVKNTNKIMTLFQFAAKYDYSFLPSEA